MSTILETVVVFSFALAGMLGLRHFVYRHAAASVRDHNSYSIPSLRPLPALDTESRVVELI